MLDEALKYALEFCQGNLKNEEIKEHGEKTVAILRDRLDAVDDASGITSFIVGGTLAKLKEKSNWKKFDNIPEWWEFKNFCEERLGKSKEWAYQRMRVWKKAKLFGMTAEQVNEIGWTVADRILSKAKNDLQVKELIEKFHSVDNRQEFFASLIEENSESDGEPKKKKGPQKRRVIKFAPDQEQFFEEALNKAAKKFGKELDETMPESEAIMLIVTDWYQAN